MPHRRRRHRIRLRSNRGQAIVEFVLIAPILMVLLLAIVQAGIAFHDYLAVTDAARAAARQAVEARIAGVTSTDVTNTAASAAADLDKTKLHVTLANPADPTFSTPGSTLTVTVTYPYSINVLGLVVASGNLSSTMTGRLE